MTIHRAIAAALCLAGASVAPAVAQSPQEAQRALFACMQKANALQLKDDKKQEFIKQCAENPDKPAESDKRPG